MRGLVSKEKYLYYDPLFRYPNTRIGFYDKIFSTEYTDCIKYKFEFHPIFSTIERKIRSKISNENPSKNIVYIGSFSLSRVLLISKIRKLYKSDLQNSFYLFNPYFFRNFSLFKINFIKDKINIDKRLEIYSKANYILSIEEPGQWCWTARIADCLALNMKILTTSPYINEWKEHGIKNVFGIFEKKENMIFNDNKIKEHLLLNFNGWISKILSK